MSISLITKTNYIVFTDDVSLNHSQSLRLSNGGDIDDVLVLAMLTDEETDWKKDIGNIKIMDKVQPLIDYAMKLCKFKSNAEDYPTQETIRRLYRGVLWLYYNDFPRDKLLKLLGELDPALKSKTN